VQDLGRRVDQHDPNTEIYLKQIIGEEALNSLSSSVDSVRLAQGALSDRFATLRGLGSLAQAGSQPVSAGEASGLPNRLWVGGLGKWVKQDNENGLYGYDYKSFGAIVGYDRNLDSLPGLTLGLSGAFSKGDLNVNDGLTSLDINSIMFSLYGAYDFGNGLFLEASVGYGQNDNETKIYLPQINALKGADFYTRYFQAGLNLGYDITLNQTFQLTPSVGLQYYHVKQNHYTEAVISDPDNLALAHWFSESQQDLLEIPISLKLKANFQTSSGVEIKPEIRAGVIIAANSPKNSMQVGFVGSADSTNLRGSDLGDTRFVGGLGLDLQFTPNVGLALNYELETGGKYLSHGGILALSIKF
jgi:outer membrane autotransporter protein